MPSSPISRASAIFAMSPRCPRFQSVIPTRTGTGFVSLVGAGAALCARATAGTAAGAIAACFTNSRRVMDIVCSVRAPCLEDAGCPWAAAFRPFGCQSCLQDVRPALPILRPLDERRGLGSIARAHVLIVPLELLSRTVGNVAEVIR